jgi:hypothetical protein
VLITVVLLLAAVGLLLAAMSTGHVVLAWGSVAFSAVVAVRILVRWRRSWRRRHDAPEDESLLLDEPVDVAPGDKPRGPAPVTPAQNVDPVTASAETDVSPDHTHSGELPAAGNQRHEHETDEDQTEPGEEDTDAADLLVVYELADEVLVVDEHPRYHLARCRWPDDARAERLPVREARELGFTPCAQCRPDKALARKHRSARATTTGSG